MMKTSLASLMRYLEGEINLADDDLVKISATVEGRHQIEMLNMLWSREFDDTAPHPPPSMLVEWPDRKMPGIDEHLKTCRWCRLQWIDAKVTGMEIVAAEKIKPAYIPGPGIFDRVTNGRFKAPGTLWYAIPAVTALAAILVLLFSGGKDGFGFNPAGKDEAGFVKASSPVKQRGLGFFGGSPIASAWPMRVGYAAAWIRNMKAVRLPDVTEEVISFIRAPNGRVSIDMKKRIREGRNPCGLFGAGDLKSLCVAGISTAAVLSGRDEPSEGERCSIVTGLNTIGKDLPDEMRMFIDSRGKTLTRSDIERVVFSIIW